MRMVSWYNRNANIWWGFFDDALNQGEKFIFFQRVKEYFLILENFIEHLGKNEIIMLLVCKNFLLIKWLSLYLKNVYRMSSVERLYNRLV